MKQFHPTSQQHIDSIIFDLVGVLFEINSAFIFRSIGIRNLLLYVLRNRKNPIDDGLQLLNKMRIEWPGQFQELIPYKNTYLPLCICQWQQGMLSSKQATQEIKKFIMYQASLGYFKNQQDKDLLLKLMSLFVDSRIGIEALKIIKPMQLLVEKLKKREYRLFILSNIDKETFFHLDTQYKSFFSNFDDIVTSFKTNLLKPEPHIFNYLLNTHKLTAQQCCFIDDQQENLATATSLGIVSVKFDTYSRLISQLKALGFVF